MDKSFLNWYTQSLGGIIGLVACMFAYLNGDMVVYGNILRNIDSISLGGILASFTLMPLCITIIFLGVYESFSDSKNENLINVNKIIVIITTLIGFIGSKLFFIIPTIFILFKYYSNLMYNKQQNLTTKPSKIEEARKKLLKTQIDISIDLLLKGADKKFICEITGLTIEDLERIEKRIQ